EVVRLDGWTSLREGDERAMADLRQDGTVLEGQPPVSDTWSDDGQRVCSYVPVLELDGTGYVGRPRHYAVAGEVRDLGGKRLGESVRVRWAWRVGGNGVLSGYGDRKQPPPDPTWAPQQARVARRGNEPTGSHTVPANQVDCHVTVAVVVQQDGVDYVTAGIP